jgi:anthranilate synthase
MAVSHRHLPWTAVQFHPESLMTMDMQVGDRLIANVVHKIRLHQPGVVNAAARANQVT